MLPLWYRPVSAWLASWQADPKAAEAERKEVRKQRRDKRREREVAGMAAEDQDAGTMYGGERWQRFRPMVALIYPPKEEEGWFGWMQMAWAAEEQDGRWIMHMSSFSD